MSSGISAHVSSAGGSVSIASASVGSDGAGSVASSSGFFSGLGGGLLGGGADDILSKVERLKSSVTDAYASFQPNTDKHNFDHKL